jgi:hypothetical protein
MIQKREECILWNKYIKDNIVENSRERYQQRRGKF